MMKRVSLTLGGHGRRGRTRLGLTLGLAGTAFAAEAISGAVQKQATNWTAIVMFLIFVAGTMVITYWAASKTKTAKDFYSAGGGITGFQNGLAIAGDYMSAASFLGISALVYTSGFDGLIYSIGFLVGWPIILFLIAEQLRNLGKYTFADVASYRLQQTPIRLLAASRLAGRRGALPDRPDGRRRQADPVAVRAGLRVRRRHGRCPDDPLRDVRRHAGDHVGPDHQGGPAALRRHLHGRHGAGRITTSTSERCSRPRWICTRSISPIMQPGTLVSDPISAISLGIALMFGTAGLPHILMRFFTVADAKEARKSVFYATGFIGYFYILTFIIGFGAIVLLMNNPAFFNPVPTARSTRSPT